MKRHKKNAGACVGTSISPIIDRNGRRSRSCTFYGGGEYVFFGASYSRICSLDDIML
jgi:hypothetical protein